MEKVNGQQEIFSSKNQEVIEIEFNKSIQSQIEQALGSLGEGGFLKKFGKKIIFTHRPPINMAFLLNRQGKLVDTVKVSDDLWTNN